MKKMIKKAVIMVICATFVTGAFAQEKKFSWGVKAGVNLADLSGKDAKGTKMKIGFNVGAVTEFHFSDKFSIGPELVYSTQGASMKTTMEDEEGDDVTVKSKMNLSYINLPIMVKYYVAENLSINLGPQFGYAVSAKAKSGSTSVKIKDGLKKFDVTIALGATYNFGKMFVDARYNYGITSISKGAKSKNNVIQVGVGYKF